MIGIDIIRKKRNTSGTGGNSVGSGISTPSGGDAQNAVHADDADHANRADEASHAASAKELDGTSSVWNTIRTWISGATEELKDVFLRKDRDDITAHKLTMGGAEVTGDAKVGGNLTVLGVSALKKIVSEAVHNNGDITNGGNITTKNLTVTGQAHFFELVIDKIKSAGGAVMITPADGFDVDRAEAVDGGYRLYWRCQDGNGNQRDNLWKVNDQALCMSFNRAKVGTAHNAANKYFWALVTAVSDTVTAKDGNACNWITISASVKDGTVNPETGDTIVMLGHRGTGDKARQSAVYISAYSSLDSGLTAPLFATYRGIDDFNLASHRKSYFDAGKAKFVGEFAAEDGTTFEDVISQAEGAKVKSVTDYFLLSNRNTGITVNAEGWSTESKATTAALPYLWKYTRTVYKNDSIFNSTPAIIANYAKDGVNGKDGKSPSVSISKADGVTTITITNADGTVTAHTVKDGINGTPGERGADGRTSYFHVKYSDDGGRTFTANSGEAVGKYIGTRTDFTESDSNTVTDYTWALIKGADGRNGVTYYTWIKYASDANGSNLSDSPIKSDGSFYDYIGFAYNRTTATESTDARDYAWSRFTGRNGVNGKDGVRGADGKDGQSLYTWIKYSDVANPTAGTQIYDAPRTATEYIGIAVNRTTATESANPSDYTWSRFKGDKGVKGDTGAKGDNGKDGTSVTITSQSTKYAVTASSAQPADGSFTSTAVPSTAVGDYLWSRTVVNYSDGTSTKSYSVSRIGTDGRNGVNGSNGKTTHFAYATSSDGKTNFSTTIFNGATFIGTYDDNSTADSTDYAKYTWTKLKGDKGDRGDRGIQGLQGLQGPRGEQGIPGTKGADGRNGTDGRTSYFHVKYSNVAAPAAASQMNETGGDYIGTYVDFTETDSSDPKAYTWVRTKGAQGATGAQGIAGRNGADGRTSYLHIAYASSADGRTGFDVSNGAGKMYIGQYTDFTQNDSADPSRYTWTLIKGDKGDSVTVKDKSVTYQVGSNGTTAPTGTWSATVPAVPKGRFLWTRTYVLYSDNTSTTTYSVSYCGTDGINGKSVNRNLLLDTSAEWSDWRTVTSIDKANTCPSFPSRISETVSTASDTTYSVEIEIADFNGSTTKKPQWWAQGTNQALKSYNDNYALGRILGGSPQNKDGVYFFAYTRKPGIATNKYDIAIRFDYINCKFRYRCQKLEYGTDYTAYIQNENDLKSTYYKAVYSQKMLSVFVDDNNPDGILRCEINAEVFLVRGTEEIKVKDKNIRLHFHSAIGIEISSATCTSTDGDIYYGGAVQNSYLTRDSNQITYCIAEIIDK